MRLHYEVTQYWICAITRWIWQQTRGLQWAIHRNWTKGLHFSSNVSCLEFLQLKNGNKVSSVNTTKIPNVNSLWLRFAFMLWSSWPRVSSILTFCRISVQLLYRGFITLQTTQSCHKTFKCVFSKERMSQFSWMTWQETAPASSVPRFQIQLAAAVLPSLHPYDAIFPLPTQMCSAALWWTERGRQFGPRSK